MSTDSNLSRQKPGNEVIGQQFISDSRHILLLLALCLLISFTIWWFNEDAARDFVVIGPYKSNEEIRARKCDYEDIVSNLADPHVWDLQWPWYFMHIEKTMGGTIFNQLPADYNSKFSFDPNVHSIAQYQNKHGVKLRKASWPRRPKMGHPAHIPLDIALEMGLLRCSDIERMNIITIIREPFSREISRCNWRSRNPQQTGVYNMSSMVHKMRRKGEYAKLKQSERLEFEYDWNVTAFNTESTDQITKWFAQYGVEVLFDEKHHQHKTAGKVNACHVDDLNAVDRLFFEEWLTADNRLYEAVQDNGGSMRIRHHAQRNQSNDR